MAQELLTRWLGLPPGSWPPDHYALLGLDPGAGPEAVEEQALDRMERLRHYQIRHPDAVTEGMNRLAQAMVTLTDPSARREYDLSIGLTTAAPGVVATVPAAAEDADEPPAPPASEELIGASPEPAPPAPEAASAEPEVIVPELAGDPGKLARGRLYAEAARLRRVDFAWRELGAFLADPGRPLSPHGEGRRLAELARELTAALAAADRPVGRPGSPGHLVAAWAAHPLATENFRGLLPSQKSSLAGDWRGGLAALRRSRRSVRAEIRSLARRGFWRRRVRPFARHLRRHPEYTLVAAAVYACMVAWVRFWPAARAYE